MRILNDGATTPNVGSKGVVYLLINLLIFLLNVPRAALHLTSPQPHLTALTLSPPKERVIIPSLKEAVG